MCIKIIEKNRFSTFVDPEDSLNVRCLVSWIKWFKDRNIEAVLRRTDKGFAVYRNNLIDWKSTIKEREMAGAPIQKRTLEVRTSASA